MKFYLNSETYPLLSDIITIQKCHLVHKLHVMVSSFFAKGKIRFYEFLNMKSLFCFPLVLLLSFVWQWFSKCKHLKCTLIYVLIFSVHVVFKFQGWVCMSGGICQGGIS